MKSLQKKELLTVQWRRNSVQIIDQTKLPNKLVYLTCTNHHEIAKAIKSLVVRGAPAIGICAALALVLVTINSKAKTGRGLQSELERAGSLLISTRPTAVNIHWAVKRILQISSKGKNIKEIRRLVRLEALAMLNEDTLTNRKLGRAGSALFYDGDVVMTHCNAGSLATSTYGTALGVLRTAREDGKNLKVIATETRPVMQGSRLTAFELMHDDFDVRLISDTAVGYVMANKMVDKVIVGADRILRTGHVYNKIGTYQIAVMAHTHKIPFYVAAPISTFDLKSSISEIKIEDRSPEEITKIKNILIAPKGVTTINPAFDITPPIFITGIITELGLLQPPFQRSIDTLIRRSRRN
ncbi:MAG TPA: S-methyl-5-thioribose-1-phosphate isomerase [Nitrososphaeraceae archaeon]|nr:S-methyl-5-thioribose-1-phosphate isomerase [Nitrososphaeraceae archaeon]